MHTRSRLILNIFMIIGILFSMSSHSLSLGIHKMIGFITFILFIIHNILNRSWYKGLFQNNYKPIHIMYTITNFIIIIATLGILISGVMLSKDMAGGLTDAMTSGRILHLVSSYAACIAIALHMGIHLKRRKDND